jgi:hypothetical protein
MLTISPICILVIRPEVVVSLNTASTTTTSSSDAPTVSKRMPTMEVVLIADDVFPPFPPVSLFHPFHYGMPAPPPMQLYQQYKLQPMSTAVEGHQIQDQQQQLTQLSTSILKRGMSEEQWKRFLQGFTPITNMTSAATQKLHDKAIEQFTRVPHYGYTSGHAGAIATAENSRQQPFWTDPKHPEMHPQYPHWPLMHRRRRMDEARHLCELNIQKNWDQLKIRMRVNLAVHHDFTFNALQNCTSFRPPHSQCYLQQDH